MGAISIAHGVIYLSQNQAILISFFIVSSLAHMAVISVACVMLPSLLTEEGKLIPQDLITTTI